MRLKNSKGKNGTQWTPLPKPHGSARSQFPTCGLDFALHPRLVVLLSPSMLSSPARPSTILSLRTKPTAHRKGYKDDHNNDKAEADPE